MADRDSAAIFGTIFEFLSQKESWDSKELALKIWQSSQHYDFSPYQMGCDKELLKLGLAKKAIDPEYPEEGKQTLYRSYSKKEEFSL